MQVPTTTEEFYHVLKLAAGQPEWKKGLEYINWLYSEGLIDPASFTQTTDALWHLVNRPGTNIIGSATVGHIGKAFSMEPGEIRHKEYVTVPPLAGPSGFQAAGYFNTVGTVITFGEYGHQASMHHLLGDSPNEALVALLSTESK